MEKNLTTEQSLDLIARMIATTRRNFNDRGGAMFLIWGYTTIVVTLAVYIAFRITRSYDTMWLWWALPLIGGILTWRHYSKYKRPVQTHLDRAVNYVWITFSIASLVCMVFAFLPGSIMPGHIRSFPILFIMSLIIGLATAITGLLIKSRPVAVGGFAGIVLAFAVLLAGGSMVQLIVFAGLMLVVQVIPGHLLNAQCKREVRAAGDVRAAKDGRTV